MSSTNKEPFETAPSQPENSSPLEGFSRFWKSLTTRREEQNGEGPHRAFLQRLKKIASPTVSPETKESPSPDNHQEPSKKPPRPEEGTDTMAEAGLAVKHAFRELGRAFSITARVTSNKVAHTTEKIAQSETMTRLGHAMKRGTTSLTEIVKSGARRVAPDAKPTSPVEEVTPQAEPFIDEKPEALDLKAKTEALKQGDRQAQKGAETSLQEPVPQKRGRGRPRKVYDTADNNETPLPKRGRGRPRKTETPLTEPSAPTPPPQKAPKKPAKKATKPRTAKKQSETPAP